MILLSEKIFGKKILSQKEINTIIAREHLIETIEHLAEEIAKKWDISKHELITSLANELMESKKILNLSILIKKIENGN